MVEELRDVVHSLGDFLLLQLLHALLIVVKHDGHEDAQQKERADGDIDLKEELERWPYCRDLKHFIWEVLRRQRRIQLEVGRFEVLILDDTTCRVLNHELDKHRKVCAPDQDDGSHSQGVLELAKQKIEEVLLRLEHQDDDKGAQNVGDPGLLVEDQPDDKVDNRGGDHHKPDELFDLARSIPVFLKKRAANILDTGEDQQTDERHR